MKVNNDDFILSTGKKFDANCGILGIVKDEEGISIYGGYDQGISSSYYDKDEQFTKEERKEIAEYVINLWKEWAK